MTENKTIITIETTSKQRAQEFILAEFDSKINHFKIERWSNEERLGKDNENYTVKINRLIEERESFLQWLASADNKSNFSIHLKLSVKQL